MPRRHAGSHRGRRRLDRGGPGDHLELEVAERLGDGHCPLTRFDRAIRLSGPPQTMGEVGKRPSQPRLIPEALSELFRVAEVAEHAVEVPEGYQGALKLQPEVHADLEDTAILPELIGSTKRLLERGDGFPRRTARECSLAHLAAVA